jgi:fused signal recognition particle receptor
MGIFSKKSIKNNIFKQPLNIKEIFSSKKLTSQILEDFEDLLISSDVGVEFTNKIISSLKESKFNKNITISEIKDFLSEKMVTSLKPVEKTLNINYDKKPYIIIFNGVNGAGKTTTIGKIAKLLGDDGDKKILVASCDSFRAAANEQLKIWVEMANNNGVNCDIIECQNIGEDPSAIAFKAVRRAKEEKFDILLIDTAGRLQNKKNLMEQLTKINKIVKKSSGFDADENILVIDARNGQNIIDQIENFGKYIDISGLIITKLDGTAKGGIILSISEKFQKPIYAIGVGEKIDDLREFSAKEFSDRLLS